MANNNEDFSFILKAVLDGSGISQDDIDKIAKKYVANIKADLDKSSLKSAFNEMWKDIRPLLNEKYGVKLPVTLDDAVLDKSINQAYTKMDKLAERANKIQFSLGNGDYDTQILAYKTSLEKLGLSADEISTKMKGVNAAFTELKTSTTGDNIISDDVISKAQTLETEMSKLSNTVKQIKLTDSLKADDLKIDSAVVRLNEQLRKNTAYSKEAKTQIKSWIAELEKGNVAEARLKEINVQAKQLHTNMAQVNKIGFSGWDKFTQGMESFKTWLSATTVVMGTISTVKNMTSAVKELDTALIDLKKTTDATSSGLEQFYYSANDTAKQLGVTTEEIINATSAWSRLGYAIEDATTMAKNSAILASISPEMDIDTATDGLVSTLKAFKIEAEDSLDGVISKINIIGNTQAVDNSDIVNILTRSSSAMAEANNTLEETIALGTAATEITRDADSVGTALKTISMRIRGRQTLPPYTVMYMLCA